MIGVCLELLFEQIYMSHYAIAEHFVGFFGGFLVFSYKTDEF